MELRLRLPKRKKRCGNSSYFFFFQSSCVSSARLMAQATAVALVGRNELWDAQWEKRYNELKCVRTHLLSQTLGLLASRSASSSDSKLSCRWFQKKNGHTCVSQVFGRAVALAVFCIKYVLLTSIE